MSNYYWICNRDKKEYLECLECGIKEYDYRSPYHCIQAVLIEKLMCDWPNSTIEMWDDGYSSGVIFIIEPGWKEVSAGCLTEDQEKFYHKNRENPKPD